MLTPRRVLLLLGGIIAFGGVFGVYSQFLGWLDGLPQVPPHFLEPDHGKLRPPERPTSPTIELLKTAFGRDCLEQQTAIYPTQLEFRNGDSSVVLAARPAPQEPGSNLVVLSPFSLAVFRKPRPEHLRQPGEVAEVSTFHADKAVLEFEKPVNTPNEMNKAKLLRVELLSEPEQDPHDPRRGLVHITNNQRSADPNQFLVLRTPGPIFYRDPKNAGPKPDSGPDIWTDAAVEIVDRRNLPRAYGAPTPPTAVAKGKDLRTREAVLDVLSGLRLPPPTATAVGMRIFLEAESKGPAGSETQAKQGAGGGGVRRVELLEKVLFHLWVDARQGFVSSPTATAGDKGGAGANPLATTDPPSAVGAVAGGSFFAAQTVRQLDRALLQIDTLGPFSYDVEKNVAQFDVIPQADPRLPNDVQVHRILPRGGSQRLFSQVLRIEFADPQALAPGKAPPANAQPGKAEAGGLSFKRLHASTYSPGRYLTVTSITSDERGMEAESLEAYGQDLVHEQATNRTVLRGSPIYAVRTNKPQPGDGKSGGSHVLTAGAEQQEAALTLEPGRNADKTITASVRGPGRIELFDPNTKQNTIHAKWQTSLLHTKETIQDRELDLLTFTDGAVFEDKQAGYWLKGKVLKLWLEGSAAGDNKANEPSQSQPHRLQALENVTCHSSDLDVEQADQLNVFFRKGLPPQTPQPAAAPQAKAPAGPPMPPGEPKGPTATAGVPPENPAPPPARKKQPLKLKARLIDTVVVRYATPTAGRPSAATKPTGPEPQANKGEGQPGGGGVKYELTRAECDGNVVVHQDPAPPERPDEPVKPRGLDIIGQTLLIDNTPDGSILTVTGTEKKLGEVHHEGNSILGPKVVIDQLHNHVVVKGRGSMVMPAGSDITGGDLQPPPRQKQGEQKPPSEVVVHWRDSMEFTGSGKMAEFIGKVMAVQGESYVTCHSLQVVFDRTISFNQYNKPPAPQPAGPRDPKAADSNNPKISKVFCYPAPDDSPDEPKGAQEVTYGEVVRDETGRVTKVQQVVARELVMTADARDLSDPRSVPYQKVEGWGPGTVRIWQLGQKDIAGPGAGAAPGGRPAPAPAPQGPGGNQQKSNESEMKLTVVQFGGRMVVKDKAKIYQEAVFSDNIVVVNAPADDPNMQLDSRNIPYGAVRLKCNDKLVVSSHKKQNGAPPVQSMEAYGNANIRTDDYDGWGETVTSDGRFVTLIGGGGALARIQKRFNNDQHTGEKIVYDRVTGAFDGKGTYSGTIQQNTSQPRPMPTQPKR